MSGYVPCACRDCMEVAIAGDDGVALCSDCKESGCDDGECQAPHACDGEPTPLTACERCNGRLGAQDPGTVCGMCKYS